MKLLDNDNDWMRDEVRWAFFKKIRTHEYYTLKKEKIKNSSKVQKMEVEVHVEEEVHDKSGISCGKTLNTVLFFANSALGHFSNKNKWKLEVWLDENNSELNSMTNCGVALIRPEKSTIYAERMDKNLNEAIKEGIDIIKKSISRDESKLNSIGVYLLGRSEGFLKE